MQEVFELILQLSGLVAPAARAAAVAYALACLAAALLLLALFTLAALTHAAASATSRSGRVAWLAAIALLPVAGPLLYLAASRETPLPSAGELQALFRKLPASYPRTASAPGSPGHS